MRSVNVEELKNDLSACLTYAKAGEEIILRDHDQPIARIVPFPHHSHEHDDAVMAVSGLNGAPRKKMDWDEFFRMPEAPVPGNAGIESILAERDESR